METVTVTTQSSRDDDGNPVSGGDPVVLQAFAISPGNTTLTFTNTGNVDSVEFTAFFLDPVDIHDGDLIQVRGRECTARVQEWINPWPGALKVGGMVVLCTSDTGAS